ncbi:HAD family hydrolase [Allorhizocola rhizosphaerae]|uniref:HAD family hydrolase n=1 Tax=Allorhizocola rhizosphaerae TaxID=1872709 RepID=UPI0013C30607|nr:haloacid dehalogenase-like hydrolase [Allorhizocola rhizosphaerae]
MTTAATDACLVLWDIDHTLIETRGVGGRLYRQAFQNVTGVVVTQEAEITGRTEHAIFDATLRLHGLEPTEHLRAGYAVELARLYNEHREQLVAVGRALPGAKAALAALAQEPGIVQTVLTGNLRAVAETKLQVFGLDRHIDFDIGAYSDDHTERAELVTIAQRRASARHGVPFERRNTVIVGDSVHDLTAARNGGAAFVGVASGGKNAGALRAVATVTILSDLTDTMRVVRAIRDICRQ